MKKTLFILPIFFISLAAHAQHGYWQQEVNYKMSIEMDVENHQFNGEQTLIYTNNSPDTLKQVFYHLYFNAFQPNSMMAQRVEQIPDPDKRMKGRFAGLTQSEIGYHKIISLTQNGAPVNSAVHGTVLQVDLQTPILPGEKAVFQMEFNSQVPVQIRRSGRNNSEGIDYTMTQWYPKMAAYDKDGWHPDQYVEREFYADFGTFDVEITLPKKYVLGGTGVLQNAEEIGHGYTDKKVKHSRKVKNLTWHFFAENVHDFAWAADPDFVHKTSQVPDGPTIHYLYDPKTANKENWEKIVPDVHKTFQFMAEHVGAYPYPQFSLIQGGDGGMEYPMSTMMLGGGKSYTGFLGLFVHESLHNWFYGVLATNEQKYPWMDEGMTSYWEDEIMALLKGDTTDNPHMKNAKRMALFLGGESYTQPFATPADLYDSKRSYVYSSYYAGQTLLMQLKYILGDEAFAKGTKMYFNRWKFKHPAPSDFFKTMEDASGIQLDWMKTYWLGMTKTADYAVKSVSQAGPSGSRIVLEKIGDRPMPVDVKITLKNGTTFLYTIPLLSMYGAKNQDPYIVQKAWPWTQKKYNLDVSFAEDEIKSVEIDPHFFSQDVDWYNNSWPRENHTDSP